MKKVLGLIFLLIMVAGQLATAQDDVKRLYDKGIHDKRPIPYPYLREADVMWSKQIWRIVDLREKMNQVLYFPKLPMGDRYSLIDVLMGEIKSGVIDVYNGDDMYNMVEKVTLDDIKKKFGAGEETISIQDPETGEYKDTTIIKDINTSEILQYMLWEEWYFDKKHSIMRVRILGICPIRIYTDPETNMTNKVRVFWAYYPDFRNTLANHEVFNPENDAHRISYDDLFMQRRFSSYIIAESNVYDNRMINQYKTGRSALLEAERIKEELFNFEHDLWEY
ncbi:MAG TPA: gliding motility protein GldN [Bacteroidetes bacterium]|nr:gliding motility protein GldN [Bacteroidota bacterium]